MNRKGCGTYDLLIALLALVLIISGSVIIYAGGIKGPVGESLFRSGICLAVPLLVLVVIVVAVHQLRYGGRGR